MARALQELAAAGVAVWLDDLSRPRIQSGSLARLIEQGDIVGITTNPTIFAKAIGAGSGYEALPQKAWNRLPGAMQFWRSGLTLATYAWSDSLEHQPCIVSHRSQPISCSRSAPHGQNC